VLIPWIKAYAVKRQLTSGGREPRYFIPDVQKPLWHSAGNGVSTKGNWVKLYDNIITVRKRKMSYAIFDLDAASLALGAGKVVAFPTETFYGLACDTLNPDAVGAVYAAKQRPYRLPLPVIVGDIGQLESIVADIPPLAKELMDMFWPGPLSIIFRALPEVPDILTAGTGRIAVRYSSHPGAAELCRVSNLVLSASSANISGIAPVTDPNDLDPDLLKVIAGVYVAPPAPKGDEPSTIVDILADGGKGTIRVLREGAITAVRLGERFPVIVADE
jgi:L-threonylcarbamoyladenylate synthase